MSGPLGEQPGEQSTAEMATFRNQSIAARLLELPPEQPLKECEAATPEQYGSLEAEFEDNRRRAKLTSHLFAGALVAAVREGAVCE